MSAFVKAGQTFLKNLMKGGKQKTTGTEVISSVNPNVPKTKIEKKIRDIKKNTQALKSSTKKLDQTTFEIVNKKFPITFKSNKGKTMSNTEKRNQGSQKLFEAAKGRKKFRSGGGTSLGMQSVKYGLDNNPNITKADPKAKFIAKNKSKKNMKKVAKSPIANSIKKGKA